MNLAIVIFTLVNGPMTENQIISAQTGAVFLLAYALLFFRCHRSQGTDPL